MEHEGDGDTNCNLWAQNYSEKFDKKVWSVGKWRMSRDQTNYNITEISQNSEKSPGDLLSLKLLVV